MRNSAPPRKRFPQSVAGMKRCHLCGTFYTPSAMLCPSCFPAGGANLGLAKAMQAANATNEPTARIVEAVGEVFIIPVRPTYPAWLKEFSRLCQFETADLEFLRGDPSQSKLVQDTAQALYCFRRGEVIPATVDLAAIEAEFNELRRRGNER